MSQFQLGPVSLPLAKVQPVAAVEETAVTGLVKGVPWQGHKGGTPWS